MSLAASIWGTVVPERKAPVASVVADPTYGVVGSVVKLNGQHSYDPSELSGRTGNDSSTAFEASTVTAPSGGFTTVDLGRTIELVGADKGVYVIAGIISTTSVYVTDMNGGSVLFTGGTSTWAINDHLTYQWRFKKTPIGSRVTQEGFRVLESDNSLVSFSPDIVGEYTVELIVANAVFSSAPAEAVASIRAILIPHARGIVPDGKFIWKYIRDVWQQVEGKELFETFWSALIQILGAEMLKLYQNDFNKSIRDIQDLYQRRWLSYEPALELDPTSLSLFLTKQLAGQGATTRNVGMAGQLIILSSTEFIVIEGSVLDNISGTDLAILYDTKSTTNIHKYKLKATNPSKLGYLLMPPTDPVAGHDYSAPDSAPNRIMTGLSFIFSFQSTTWDLGTGEEILDYALAMTQSPNPLDFLLPIVFGLGPAGGGDIRVGDVIHYPSGPNAGFYRIVEKAGSRFIVDRAPPNASDNSGGAVTSTAYRPVNFEVLSTQATVGNTFAIPFEDGLGSISPGQVITLGDRAFTVLRSVYSPFLSQPLVIFTAESGEILTNLDSLSWRSPNTLVSSTQNFEELGVSEGDLLWVEVHNSNSQKIGTIPAQVVGVDRNRLGFVFTDEDLVDGVVSTIPNATYETLASAFNIEGVSVDITGMLQLTGDAKKISDVARSAVFLRTFLNKEITTSYEFTILGGSFRLVPKTVIRNRKIPVDVELRSVPVLQDWIVQPTTVVENGKLYQVSNGQKFEIPNTPYSLVENSDFILDGGTVVDDTMVFETGSNIVFSEDGRFVERDLRNGDTFQVLEPQGVAGTYYIKQALSSDELLLTTPLPARGRVSARVQIKRRKSGTFLRFVPGGFTPKKPAPRRLWGEVSFFDNSSNVESNFGILVNLSRSALEDISSNINYRQAVSGLMFAYSRGPAINKIRLGAQILLGLPFAEHRGIIRSIESDYRLDEFGTPILGRLLIEDTDQQWNPMGVMRVYTYPIDLVSELAGLDVNPSTGKPYAVGDQVDLLAALSKGVEVNDYQTDPIGNGRPAKEWLQQFHTVRLRANDGIFSIDELSLLSGFVKNITPSYVARVITILSEFADTVEVKDKVGVNIGSNGSALIDNPYFRLAAPLMFDGKTMSGNTQMITEEGFFWIRSFGRGLVTTLGATAVTITRGDLARIGDRILFLGGANKGLYPITGVAGNSVSLGELPASGLQSETQDYELVRLVDAEIRRGIYSATGGSDTASIETGALTDGVSPGDLFVTASGKWFYIKTVSDASLTILGAFLGGTGVGYRILREPLIASPATQDWATGTVTVSGGAYSAISNPYLAGLLDVGDELEVQDSTHLRLFAIDPENLVFVPVLPNGTYPVALCKRAHLPSMTAPGTLEYMGPEEVLELALRESEALAACATGSPNVLLQMQRTLAPTRVSEPLPSDIDIRPGDFLVLTSGGNSMVDVGYGPGVYPIASVAASEVTLSTNLTSDDDSAWKTLRRR